MFRAFLDQRVERRRSAPGRVRAHAASWALHAAGLTLLVLAARELDSTPPDPATPPGLMVSLLRPVAFATTPAASGPAASRVADPAPAPARRRTPTRAPRAAMALEAPEPTALPGPDLAPGGETAIMDDGGLPGGAVAVVVSGDGTGDGAGGAGNGGRGRRRPELFGRVIGSGLRRGSAVRADLPFISLKEATTLRTEDHFPRLPAALWTERGPYLVALQVCVSAEGRVSEAALMSSRSAQLDPLVLQAVRGWRYRPRLQDGAPGPFCHGILIKYEISY